VKDEVSGNGDGQLVESADLPPVETPSAEFIVRLFLIPLAIVVVLVGGWWLLVWFPFGKLPGGERDPLEYVRIIGSRNEARRWRAAYELASLIQTDADLAEDPKLLGALTELLDTELDRKKDGDPQVEQYLAGALGAFHTREAESPGGKKLDPIATLTRAAGPDRPEEVRQAAAEALAIQAARRHDTLEAPEAVRALDQASQAGGPALRWKAVYALGFFGGDEALEVLRRRLGADDPYVRVNAAVPLARRGDLSCLPVAREMLSTKDLDQVIRLDNPAEKRATIDSIQVGALHSLEESIRHHRPELAERLRPEVEALSRSGTASIRTAAGAVLKSLPKAR
jgi:HEAT repeat protein